MSALLNDPYSTVCSILDSKNPSLCIQFDMSVTLYFTLLYFTLHYITFIAPFTNLNNVV